jgi:hypothetical protein
LLNSYIYILLNNDFSKHVLWSPVSKPLDVLAAYISATLHVTSPCYALDGIPLVKHKVRITIPKCGSFSSNATWTSHLPKCYPFRFQPPNDTYLSWYYKSILIRYALRTIIHGIATWGIGYQGWELFRTTCIQIRWCLTREDHKLCEWREMDWWRTRDLRKW